jgi:hypothetical protein
MHLNKTQVLRYCSPLWCPAPWPAMMGSLISRQDLGPKRFCYTYVAFSCSYTSWCMSYEQHLLLHNAIVIRYLDASDFDAGTVQDLWNICIVQ